MQGAEVEYSLRAVPLGGFVAFPDDDPDSSIPPDDPDLLKNRPILDRAIVISAGVIANCIFAFTILFTQVRPRIRVIFKGFVLLSIARPAHDEQPAHHSV